MGLVACWRETLLAQAVLAERTRGYRNHPQLERFRAQNDPIAAVGAYLTGIAHEATRRGYRFDTSRILCQGAPALPRIPVTHGQVALEWQHLGAKLRVRSAEYAEQWTQGAPTLHPLFTEVPGDVEPWERAEPSTAAGTPNTRHGGTT